MLKMRHFNERKRILIAGFAGLFAVAMVFAGVLANAFAATSYYLTDGGEVMLDGTEDKSVTISLATPIGDEFFSFQGTFTPSVVVDETTYITLTALTPGGNITPSSNEIVDGRVLWTDSTFANGFSLNAGEAIWSATYSIDKDTPAGEYEITLSDAELATESSDYETLSLSTLTTKIKVAREAAKQQVSIASATVADKSYDGTIAAEVSSVTFDGAELGAGDYTATATFDSANAGERTATVVVELTEDSAKNYTLTDNTYTATATISRAAASNAVATIAAQKYTGSALEPVATVTGEFNGERIALVHGVDYGLTYAADIVGAGEYQVGINSLDSSNYSFVDFTETFTVERYEITASNVSLEYDAVRYNGAEQKPSVAVKIGDYVVDASAYDVSYSEDVIGNDTDTTTVTVTVTARDDQNITGSATVEYMIVPHDILVIGGISDQDVTYTGSPVELAGSLTVSGNNDGVTAKDLTTTWYAADGTTVIDQPTNAGAYVVKYTYDGVNYKGALVVNFNITKAVSPMPAEMAGYRAEVGTALAGLASEWTTGFNWDTATTTVVAGDNTYAATYTYNNDTANYTTLDLAVPVYGLSRIEMTLISAGEGSIAVVSGNSLDSILEGETVVIEFAPKDGNVLSSVKINGMEVIDRVSDGKLVIEAGNVDTIIVAKFVPVYEVIEGAEQTYIINEGGAAIFRIDADFALFENGGEVYVDGELVDSENYTAESGSTVIALSADYMSTLAAENHELKVVFNNGGVATTTFAVYETEEDAAAVAAPDTGVFTTGVSVAAGVVMLPVLVAGMVGAVKTYGRRKTIKFN